MLIIIPILLFILLLFLIDDDHPFLMVLVTFLMLISLACSFTEAEYELKDRYEIESLDVLNGLSGGFTLGSGRIENKPIYYFYRKTTEGYILQSIGGKVKDNLVIVRPDSDKHYLEVYEKKGNFWHLSGEARKYIIVVPENTIKREFNANIVGG